MTEETIVERLRSETVDVPIPGLPFCTQKITRPVCEEAASLIERLQKELEEARELLVASRNDMASEEMAKHLVDWLDACPGILLDESLRDAAMHNIGETIKDAHADIRAKTIEDCARVADAYLDVWDRPPDPHGWEAMKLTSSEIARAIRNLEGGGK